MSTRGPLTANAALLAATDWQDEPDLDDLEATDGATTALPPERVLPMRAVA